MKAFLVISVFSFQASFAQLNIDSINIGNLKTYNSRLSNLVYRVDTTKIKSDSIAINYISRTGDTIAKQLDVFSNMNSQTVIKTDSTIIFFNDQGYMEYTESWRLVTIGYDIGEQGVTQLFPLPDPYLTYRSRINYDNEGREILGVIKLTSGGTLRTRTSYSLKGKIKSRVCETIPDDEFWK